MMKLAAVISTPEIKMPISVALLSGTFPERLQKAAQLGFDGVELMVVRPNELDTAAIREHVTRLGLEVAAVGSGAIPMVEGLTLLADDANISHQAVTRLHQLIEFATAVNAPLVTIGGFRGRLGGKRDGRSKLITILHTAADKAASRGMRLVLEPLNRYETDIIHNTREGLSLIREVGHTHLGLLLDTFHVNIEEASLSGCFRQAMTDGRLWHIHLGDNNRLPPGQGHIDFANILSVLHEIGYTGYLSAELLAQPDADAAAATTIAYMRRLNGNIISDKPKGLT